MANSIHTARWLNQVADQGWEIYLFPSYDNFPVHPLIRANGSVTVHAPWSRFSAVLYRMKLNWVAKIFTVLRGAITRKINPGYYPKRLQRYIKKTDPLLIHSMETQGAGYLVSEVKPLFKREQFPVWWHTNWGSDIFLFGRLQQHKQRIQAVLRQCDFYSCECNRDIRLAREFGFAGQTFPVYPNTGGFDLEALQNIRRNATPTSMRKTIMLKGYQGWAGRALAGLRALERCADVLKGYRLVIYSNTAAADIQIAAELFSVSTGVPVELMPENSGNIEILKKHSEARISIGLSISDSISISLLESMAMGSFPVQSDTSSANEWIVDNETGFIVPPEDPEIIEQALRKALANDDMVDKAATKNWNTIAEKAEYNNLKKMTIGSYKEVSEFARSRKINHK